MAISAQDVKKLREMTQVGMMDCKRALEEADGDFDKAIEILRKKGRKVSEKRKDREAKEGLIVAKIADDNKRGIIVEVNCETDFVARNEVFAQFADDVAALILRAQPVDLDALKAFDFKDGRAVGEALTDLTGKIGEKLGIRRFQILRSDQGQIISYIHPGARLGVLIDLQGNGHLEAAGRDVAMQVAALNPVATRREEVSQEVQQKELDIGREAARNQGKPEHLIDRIATGKLERYFKDHVLVEQPFVKDASRTVKQMLQQAEADVRTFVRFALGD